MPYAAQTQYAQETPYITGITRDSSGNALPGCFVDCFTAADDVRRFATLSDLVTGAYSFQIGPGTGPYYCVAFKPGLPEVGGVTVESLASFSNTFNSTLMTGCQLWAKADVLGATLNNGDLISSWTDSSGSGNTLTQSVDANKPTYQAGLVNGLPVALFPVDGAAFLTSTAPASQKPVTLFAVCYLNGNALTNRWIFFMDLSVNSGVNLNIRNLANGFYGIELTHGTAIIIAQGVPAMSVNTWYVIEATYSATGDYALYVNGAPNITPGTNDVSVSALHRVIGKNNSSCFGPYIAEVLQFNSVLSSADRYIIRSYLARKYAISITGTP